MKTKYPHFNQLDSFEKLKIILNPVIPDKEILPSHRPVNIILWGVEVYVDAERLRALTCSMLIDLSVMC
jgi:hypothetical protein